MSAEHKSTNHFIAEVAYNNYLKYLDAISSNNSQLASGYLATALGWINGISKDLYNNDSSETPQLQTELFSRLKAKSDTCGNYNTYKLNSVTSEGLETARTCAKMAYDTALEIIEEVAGKSSTITHDDM